mgnify:FL=1
MSHQIPAGRKNRSQVRRNGVVRSTRKPSGNYPRNYKGSGATRNVVRRNSNRSRSMNGVIGRKRTNGRRY